MGMIIWTLGIHTAFAQVEITEVMYNLEGSDAKREWVEIYNASGQSVDMSGWRLFESDTNHKLTPVQEGAILGAGEYAIIADNPDMFLAENAYAGVLFDSAFSLKNGGELLVLRDANLSDVDSVSYDPAIGGDGDGNSLQKSADGWIAGIPTPGRGVEVVSESGEEENGENASSEDSGGGSESGATGESAQSSGQSFSADPKIFANAGPPEITAIVGADTVFSGEAIGIKGFPLVNERYSWVFGDGGVAEGSTVTHAYMHPGTYIVVLNVSSGGFAASDTVTVRVVPPRIAVSRVGYGAGSFIEIRNDTEYKLNLSRWLLRSGESLFAIPEDTFILPNGTLAFPERYTNIRLASGDGAELLFPNGVVASSYREKKPERAGSGEESRNPRPVLSGNSPPAKRTARTAAAAVLEAGAKVLSEEIERPVASAPRVAAAEGSGGEYSAMGWFMAVLAVCFIAIGGIVAARRGGSDKTGFEIIEDE